MLRHRTLGGVVSRTPKWPMHHLTRVRRRLDALGWALLPGICILCNARSGVTADLCRMCCLALPRIAQPCDRCALPVAAANATRCAKCQAHPPPYARAVAALRYAEPVTRMIHRLKFAGSRVDARVVGSLLAKRLCDAYRGDSWPSVVIPVPLSRERLLRRGHNQAALLARWVGSEIGIPVDYGGCRRIRHTPPQTGLNRAARLRNLSAAFSVAHHSLHDLRVAVVDDVMTTGSTAVALTHALLTAGAAEVHIWVAARTPEPDIANV